MSYLLEGLKGWCPASEHLAWLLKCFWAFGPNTHVVTPVLGLYRPSVKLAQHVAFVGSERGCLPSLEISVQQPFRYSSLEIVAMYPPNGRPVHVRPTPGVPTLTPGRAQMPRFCGASCGATWPGALDGNSYPRLSTNRHPPQTEKKNMCSFAPQANSRLNSSNFLIARPSSKTKLGPLECDAALPQGKSTPKMRITASVLRKTLFAFCFLFWAGGMVL